MPQAPDPRLTAWKEAFRRGDMHPYMPVVATLIEAEDKFDGAEGFLRTLDPTDPQQVKLGVAIGRLAARYAGAVMENFGLWDDGNVPQPVNMAQAQKLVENFLVEVRQRIAEGRRSVAADADEHDASTDEQLDEVLATTAAIPNPPRQSTSPVTPATQATDDGTDGVRIVPDQHAVIQGDKKCRIGAKKEFKLIEFLWERIGLDCSHDMIRNKVWGDGHVSDDSLYQTVRNLRRMLKDAGIEGVEIKAGKGFYTLTLT